MLTGTGLNTWRSDEDEIRTTKPCDGAWKNAGDLKQIEFVMGTRFHCVERNHVEGLGSISNGRQK